MIDGLLVTSSLLSFIWKEKSAPTANGGSLYMSLTPPCFSISSRSGPFTRDERTSLLSPHINLFVQPFNCLPRSHVENRSTRRFSPLVFVGSSTCSME